jgi:hypothetical protein
VGTRHRRWCCGDPPARRPEPLPRGQPALGPLQHRAQGDTRAGASTPPRRASFPATARVSHAFLLFAARATRGRHARPSPPGCHHRLRVTCAVRHRSAHARSGSRQCSPAGSLRTARARPWSRTRRPGCRSARLLRFCSTAAPHVSVRAARSSSPCRAEGRSPLVPLAPDLRAVPGSAIAR